MANKNSEKNSEKIVIFSKIYQKYGKTYQIPSNEFNICINPCFNTIYNRKYPVNSRIFCIKKFYSPLAKIFLGSLAKWRAGSSEKNSGPSVFLAALPLALALMEL